MRSLISLSLLTLVGCAVMPSEPVSPSLALPVAWARTAATPSAGDKLAQWWPHLGDPQLSDLIARALQASPDLRNARARLRAARARHELASAQLEPSVNARGAASASRRSSADTVTSTSTAFDASWEIDLFGARRFGVDAALADEQASAAAVDGVRVSLAAEVARNYVELRALQSRLAIVRSNLASQSETLLLTEWRRQAGLVGSLDVEQARASREQTRAQEPVLQTSLAQAQHRLAILLGQPPGGLDHELEAAAPIPRPPSQIAIDIPAEVMRQRPDVRAAEQAVAAEAARVKQAQAAMRPSFSLSASLGLDAATLGGLLSGPTLARSVAIGLAMPVFEGGRLRQQIEIQRAAREGAEAALFATLLGALEEVENALVSFANAATRQAALTDARDAARAASLLARQRYSAGLIDFQVVLTAERSLLAIEDSLASSEAERVLGVIQLYKALGGGW